MPGPLMRHAPHITAATLLSLAAGAAAHPVTWDGDAGDGLWTSPTNWDPDALPSMSSLVDIPAGSGQVSLVLSGATVSTLTCGSSLRLDSASIETLGPSSVMNLVVVGGFNPTITTGGAFAISGASSAQSLTINGTGSFTNTGAFEAQSVGIDGVAAFNEGAWITPMGSGLISLSAGATLENSGTITLREDSSVDGPGELANTGIIARLGGAGIASINAPLNQTSGSLRATGTGATLAVESQGWSVTGGVVTVLDNGVVALGGSNTMTQTRTIGPVEVSGTGSVQFFANNSTINWEGETVITVQGAGAELRVGTHHIDEAVRNSALMEARGAMISGPGAFTNTAPGTFTVPLGNAFTAATTLNNRGAFNLNGTLFLNDGAVVNHTNGTIDLGDDAVVMTQTALDPGEIRSNADVRFNADVQGETVVIAAPFSAFSNSTTHTQDGYLVLAGGGVLSGANFTFAGTFEATLLAIEGDAKTVYTVPVSSFFNDPNNGMVYRVRFGVNTSEGPDISISVDEELICAVLAIFNNAITSGPGTFKNAGGMLWNGGTMGSTFTSIANLVIPFGADPELSGEMLTLATVEHSGSLELNGGTVDNQSTWTMKDGGTLAAGMNPGLFTNNAQFVADDPALGNHLISAPFSNLATVEAVRGHLAFSGDVAQFDRVTSDLSGGLWIATQPDASITFTQAMVRLSNGVVVRGGSAGFPEIGTLERIESGALAQLLDTVIAGPLVNDDGSLCVMGDVLVNSDYMGTKGSETVIEPGGTFETTGTIQIGEELDTAADDINPIVTIARTGVPAPSIVTPLLDLHDTFTINGSGTGVVHITGDLFMQPSATLTTHLAQASSVDELAVEGHTTLGGTLLVEILDGPPAFGETFLLLAASEGVSGAIDDVVVTNADPILTFTTEIIGNELYITAASSCGADLDNNGVLDFSDVSTFLSLFAAGDLRIDYDGSGMLDFVDVSIFLSIFAQGCP